MWWTTSQSGDVHFNDGESHSDCYACGPHVFNASFAQLQDVHERSAKCWADCISLHVHIPIESIRLYNNNGDLVSVENVQPLTEDMDATLNSSIPCEASLVPPIVSTPMQWVVVDPPSVQISPVYHLPDSKDDECEEVQLETDADDVCTENEEGGYVDMQVSEPVQEASSELTSTVCKALSKVLGNSAALVEFDKVRTTVKSRAVKLPCDLHKHKKYARHFRKLVSRQKAHLEELLETDEPQSANFVQHSHDLRLCLKLICNLH